MPFTSTKKFGDGYFDIFKAFNKGNAENLWKHRNVCISETD